MSLSARGGWIPAPRSGRGQVRREWHFWWAPARGGRQRRTRKDILILYLSFPMSLRFYFMSLRGHPKEAAAISPYLSVSTSTRDYFVVLPLKDSSQRHTHKKSNPPVNGRVTVKLSCLALCAQLLIVDSPISIHPCLRASTTAWVRSLASSLSRIEVTWFLIVCSLMPRTWAICLLE